MLLHRIIIGFFLFGIFFSLIIPILAMQSFYDPEALAFAIHSVDENNDCKSLRITAGHLNSELTRNQIEEALKKFSEKRGTAWHLQQNNCILRDYYKIADDQIQDYERSHKPLEECAEEEKPYTKALKRVCEEGKKSLVSARKVSPIGTLFECVSERCGLTRFKNDVRDQFEQDICHQLLHQSKQHSHLVLAEIGSGDLLQNLAILTRLYKSQIKKITNVLIDRRYERFIKNFSGKPKTWPQQKYTQDEQHLQLTYEQIRQYVHWFEALDKSKVMTIILYYSLDHYLNDVKIGKIARPDFYWASDLDGGYRSALDAYYKGITSKVLAKDGVGKILYKGHFDNFSENDPWMLKLEQQYCQPESSLSIIPFFGLTFKDGFNEQEDIPGVTLYKNQLSSCTIL